jgi:hypothetical protein
MSLSFMVLGGPRSATTWMANLLTTDHTWCIHDPFLEYTLDQVTQLYVPEKRIGISCTASILHPEWVNVQRCPKIILYRDPDEINASLRQLGMIELEITKHNIRMHGIKAPMYRWENVFKQHVAKDICDRFSVPFDIYRFRELVKMNIQPQWNRLPVGKEALVQLQAAIHAEISK